MRLSAFYLPLRQPTDGAPAPWFRQLPLHLKKQHGERRNFNRERIKRCKKTYGIVISILHFIIKFPYNAHSDWLKQRTLSEYKGQVNDIKLAFKFLLRNFDTFDLN